MDDYRTRLYMKYATVSDALPGYDDSKRNRAFDHYLRGWLPVNVGARILDVGCGSGALLRYLLARGYPNVEGIDISPEQVDLARQVGLSVDQGNAIDYLIHKSSAYDVIFLMDVIEHLAKAEVLRLLDCCREALRPGGRLVLQTPNGESPFAGAIKYGDFTHEVIFSPRSLSQVLTVSGFRDVAMREVEPILSGYSVPCTVRSVLWKLIRRATLARNYVETGGPGSGVLTRVFLASAVRA